MLKKIILTVVPLILVFGLIGYVLFNESGRMATFQEKQEAEFIEQGALVYADKCATCHGEHGKADLCYATNGQQIGCSGRPLNSIDLLCDEPSLRLMAVEWEGTTEAYIRGITTIGRSEKGMPAFGKEFVYEEKRGLSQQQIDDVTAYILNYANQDFVCRPALSTLPWSQQVSDLPAGDPVAGEQHFHVTYGCSACHGDPAVEGSNAVGPWSGNFKHLDDRIEGYLAADYVYESVLNPNAYISPDCPMGPCAGPPSAMPANFALRLEDQDLADIMAFLGVDPQQSSGIKIKTSH